MNNVGDGMFFGAFLNKPKSSPRSDLTINNQDEESKLLLLLWDAKADLFVQAVHIQAEMRPITDSKSIGARLGTKLKEKIYKARQARRPAVKRYIDTFNRRYQNYTTKFPDQTLSDAADYPLAYDDFVNFPLDHRFWNDGLYYHSKAPWAIDPEVRAGINATLMLSRVQEEFQLLAQELCRAIGWGVAHSKRLEETIGHISRRKYSHLLPPQMHALLTYSNVLRDVTCRCFYLGNRGYRNTRRLDRCCACGWVSEKTQVHIDQERVG
jgi:hypothetical protein